MTKSESHRERLRKVDEQIMFDIGFILASMPKQKTAKICELTEALESPADGSKCFMVGIRHIGNKILVEISPNGEIYDLLQFGLEDKITILEGLENGNS